MRSVELLPAREAVPANPQWHELRRAAISASEIAMVLGISPFGSPFSLYWQKVNGWEVEETAEMRAGRYAEPAIIRWFEDECDPNENLTLRGAGLYASRTRSWQLATPDALVCQDRLCGSCDAGLPMGCTCDKDLLALLECKYVIGGWDGWGELGTDDVPVYYRAQCLWQADVLDLDQVYLAAWHGAEFRCYQVRRDEKDLRVMRTAGEAFMDRLAAGEPPALDGHQATIRTLKALHPSIEDIDVEVPAEFAEGYRRARALSKRAAAVVDRYEARARSTLGRARRLVCNGHLVCSRSVYDQSGDMVELDSLDADAPTVDRLNPGRTGSYLTPKKGPKR